jgi:hypothetical protein
MRAPRHGTLARALKPTPSAFTVVSVLRRLIRGVLWERPEASDELILKAVITRIRNYPDAAMRRALCNWVGID